MLDFEIMSVILHNDFHIRSSMGTPKGAGAMRNPQLPKENLEALLWVQRRLAWEQWLDGIRDVPASRSSRRRIPDAPV
jgi:hypothetical protein